MNDHPWRGKTGQTVRERFRASARLPWFIRLRAGSRLLIAVGMSAILYLATVDAVFFRTRALVCWDVGAYVYLSLALATIVSSDAASTRDRSRMQDSSRYVILVLVLTASVVSLVAIGFLVGNLKELSFWDRALRVMLTVLALTSSWLLIHTLFAFHYARQFYRGCEGPGSEDRGLQFGGTNAPDFRGFAYFAFVVGMTSQTSDTPVTTREMRRLTLVHSVLSFVFNIAILAMSINIIAGII